MHSLFLIKGFAILTKFSPLGYFADKRYVVPNISFVNVADLNRVLRSEVFVSADWQLRVVHLILGFEPLSNNFQDASDSFRAGDPRLA